MKDFFSRYSYKTVKMFITQVAIGLFGAVLTFAISGLSNTILIITSIFAILFYLFLIYTNAWEIGATDRISIDVGKMKRRPWLGIVLSLIANIPNFIVAVIYSICWLISHGVEGTATNIAAIMRVVALFIEGMYIGILAVVNHSWWAYFVIIIPSVIVSGVAYWLGTKNAKLTTMMDPVYPESDREKKIKKEKKKED